VEIVDPRRRAKCSKIKRQGAGSELRVGQFGLGGSAGKRSKFTRKSGSDNPTTQDTILSHRKGTNRKKEGALDGKKRIPPCRGTNTRDRG